MIVLSVEEYCHSCLDFTPDVTQATKTWSDDEGGFVLGDTLVRCKHRKRCVGIKRYLENQMKEEVSG